MCVMKPMLLIRRVQAWLKLGMLKGIFCLLEEFRRTNKTSSLPSADRTQLCIIIFYLDMG